MKKIIAVLLLIFLSSSSFSLLGQKISKRSQRTEKTVSTPQLKTDSSELKSTEAFSDGNGVLLKWQTATETNLIGFNIYRQSGQENVRVNSDLIVSSQIRYGHSFGNSNDYIFFDEKGGFQGSYVIESIFTDGRKNFTKPVLPRYTADLANVSAMSSEAFRQSKLSAQSSIQTSKLVLPDSRKAATGNGDSLADIDRQKWVASQPGVKISVTKEGFYRVTRAELQAAGFNVNAPADTWQLYLNGEEQAIIAEEKGAYIEFYAAPFADALESGNEIYYLLAGSNPGRRIEDQLARRLSASVEATNYFQVQTLKQRATYLPSLRNGDTNNFYGTFISTTPATVNFDLKGIDYSVTNTDVTLVVQGISLTPHSVKAEINGQEVGTFTGSNHVSMRLDLSVPTQFLNEGTNTLRFTALGGSSDFSFFDSISVNLKRKYTADQNQLSFYSGSYKTTRIGGFTSPNIRVFDLTYRNNPALLYGLTVTENSGIYTVTIPSNRQRIVYAVADDAVKQVSSITQNTPSTLSTAAHNGKLTIVTHKNWMTEANAWATYRTADGFTVEVVDIEDIYDEFSYGKFSSKAITDFAQYAKNNWQTPPQYILLMGDATYDPRNFTGLGFLSYVPTRMVDTTYTETGSDDALTDFDNDGLADITIGRIPARNPGDVTQMLNKVSTFEQTVNQASARGALCASDLFDGFDFAALCERIMGELPAGINKTYVNRGETNAPTTLLNNLNSGKYVVNYSGHGHTTIWASGGFFNSTTALNLTNGSDLSIFTMLTCLNGYFIEPGASSLSENLLWAQNGGAVAAWSSSSLSTTQFQEIMTRRFFNQLGGGSMTRMGDLVNDAKSVIPAGRDVRLAWVLLGDPTLKVK